MKIKFWLKMIYLALGMLLITVQVTDADMLDEEIISGHKFMATTLDFSLNDTVNNTDKIMFISMSGLLPKGFGVASLRLNNQGKLGFNYQASLADQGGSGALCGAMQVRVMRNWQVIYEGQLTGMQFTGSLTEKGSDDLVFALSLPSADASLIGQSCNFKIKFANQKPEGSFLKFSDEEVLDNVVTTGSW